MAEKDSCSIDLVLSEVTKCNHFTTVNKEEKQYSAGDLVFLLINS